MFFHELYANYRNLCDRYLPSLSSKENAYRALKSVDNDPDITENEKAALTEYVGNYTIDQHVQLYTWCDICEKMIGFIGGRHRHCERCELPCPTDNFVDSCAQCSDCCCDHCLICDRCEDHIDDNNPDDWCDACHRCISCCSCVDDEDEEYDEDEEDNEDDEELEENKPSYGKPLTVSSRKDMLQFKCSRLAGIEWEYNQVGSYKSLEDWKKKWGGTIHYDGSCGEEAVTPPMAGDFICKVITDLGNAFKLSHVKIDNRCSVHVHVDASDYSWHDMFKLLKVYSKLEPILYLLAGQQRLLSKYCIPLGKDLDKIFTNSNGAELSCPDYKGAILAVALQASSSKDARELQRGKPGKRTGGRYRGLNINPWLAARRSKSPDATVEFRMHRDCYETNRIIGWTQLCVRIVDWCLKSSVKDIENLPKSPLRALCQTIAPDCAGWILSRIKEWRKSTNKFTGRFGRRIHVRGGKYEY